MCSKCGIIDCKTPFSHTRQWSNCVVTVTASNTNFHSWVMQLQINQTNHVFVSAISGPGCNISSTCSRAAPPAREAQLFLRAPQWEIGWALADFSTMWHKLRWWWWAPRRIVAPSFSSPVVTRNEKRRWSRQRVTVCPSIVEKRRSEIHVYGENHQVTWFC